MQPRNAPIHVHTREGFTLLEVLVALAILGTAMFILLDAHGTTLRLHTAAKEEVLARSLLERATAMAEVQVMAGTFNGSDEFGERYPGYRYTFDAQAMGQEYPGLVEVRVEIEGPEDEPRELFFRVFSMEQAQALSQ